MGFHEEPKAPRTLRAVETPEAPAAPAPRRYEFAGTVTAVKARIHWVRCFYLIRHSYLGYILVLDGTLDGRPVDPLRVAVGPNIYDRHEFCIGDEVRGTTEAIPPGSCEWATHYKAAGLRMVSRAPADQERPANPAGGIAPTLRSYRTRGHRRLDGATHAEQCQRCPFGLVMPTQYILDLHDPANNRWRPETHCYGPRDCPRYNPGEPYEVPGGEPGEAWVDDDVEREARTGVSLDEHNETTRQAYWDEYNRKHLRQLVDDLIEGKIPDR